MDSIAINNFVVSVSEPYPCYVTIKYDGKELVRVHYAEIKDLEYALSRATEIAYKKLVDNDFKP